MTNTNPFVMHTPEDIGKMLKKVGVTSVDELFTQQIPEDLLLSDVTKLQLPVAADEMTLQRELNAIALANDTDKISFLGGGIYDHFIPAAVDLLASRGEFVTAYTPYQPEVSQGILQVFFEYQTMVAGLLGMDVANASMYDVASGAGEAVLMAISALRGRNEIIVPESIHPDIRETIHAYTDNGQVQIVNIPVGADGIIDTALLEKSLGEKTACVLIQHPNYLGCLEQVQMISDMTHKAGALLVAVVDPVSLGLLEAPGVWGADIAVADGQGIGLPMYAGGETVGLFACKQSLMRKMPGRIIGMTKDVNGKRGYVLTLQTREQHIRREKATSNICSNHALNALKVTIHLSLMGARGLTRVARLCLANMARLKAALPKEAIVYNAPCFKEIVVRTKRPVTHVLEEMLAEGYYAGIDLKKRLGSSDYDNCLLMCVTEKRTNEEIDTFAQKLRPMLVGGEM